MFRVALYQPEIPQNTGNISRLSVGTGCELNLIRPVSFALSDRRMRRAGLDHWGDVRLVIHDDLEAFERATAGCRLAIFTKRGLRPLWEHSFEAGDVLLFGNETRGLPREYLLAHRAQTFTLPMVGPIRSLNLGNSVAVAVYEGLRQLAARGRVNFAQYAWDDDLRESFDLDPAP
jgi:tRNA (cytidine/uridine-2'-O-)-methyltransferase